MPQQQAIPAQAQAAPPPQPPPDFIPDNTPEAPDFIPDTTQAAPKYSSGQTARTGDYQTRRGGPIRNINDTDQRGPVERLIQSMNEGAGLPRSVSKEDLGDWWDSLTKPSTVAGEKAPRGSPLNIPVNIYKSVERGMEETEKEGEERFPPGSFGRGLYTGLSRIPLVGPGIVDAAHEFENKDYASGAGHMLGLSAAMAASDPEVREAAGRGGARLIENIRTPDPEARARNLSEAIGAKKPGQLADVKNVANRPEFQGVKSRDELTSRARTEGSRIWSPVEEALGKFDASGNMIQKGKYTGISVRSAGDEISTEIRKSIQLTDAQRNPAAVKRIQSMADGYKNTSFTMGTLEQMRLQTSAEMDKIRGQYPRDAARSYKVDPEWRAARAENDTINNILDRELNKRGIDYKSIRKDIGPVKGVSKLAEKAEMQKPRAMGLKRAVGATTGAIGGSAAGSAIGHPYWGASAGAGAGATLAGKVLGEESPTDYKIRKALRKPRWGK